MNLFGISIGVVLGLALGNYFDTSIGSLIFYSVYLELGTLIGNMMEPLLGSYMGRYLELFILIPLYFYFSPLESLFESDSLYNVLQFILYIPPG